MLLFKCLYIYKLDSISYEPNVFVLGIVDISLGFPGNVPKVIAAHFRFVKTDSRYGEYAAGNGTKLSTNVSSTAQEQETSGERELIGLTACRLDK